jgi:predicted SAM-dependent methyltransferase
MVRISKYFKIDNWKERLGSKNRIINKMIRSLKYDDLLDVRNLQVAKKDFSSAGYMTFLSEIVPNWEGINPYRYYKKFMEFYISYLLLNPSENDVILDAAGGIDTYVSSLPCKKKYVSDVNISDRFKNAYGKRDIVFIERSAANIPLADGSVNRISCHHSIEHFQADADKEFIDEVQRLLAPGGSCCIIPIFISDKMFEVVNVDRPGLPFDRTATKIVSPTTPFSGGAACGDFTRVYNLESFQERIVARINTSLFKTSLFQFTMDSVDIPDLKLKCHRTVAKVNYPYRALLIERLS